MKIFRNVVLLFAVVIIASLFACSPKSNEITSPDSGEVEIKYDQGESAGSCSSGQQGFLVRFDPTETAFKIEKVKLFANLRGIASQERQPKLEIWDKSHHVIFAAGEPYDSFSSEPGWISIDIPEITVYDDFYVAFYTNSRRDNGIYIYYDLSTKNISSEMVADGNIVDWVWGDNPPKEKTNWMIRILGKPRE